MMSYMSYFFSEFLLRICLRKLFYFIKSLKYRILIKNKGGLTTGDVRFWIYGDLVIGEKIIIQGSGIDGNECSQIVVAKEGCLSIEDNVGITQTSIQCFNSITISKNVKIGAGCIIMDTDFHSVDWQQRKCVDTDSINAKTAPIFIGDSAFIGARCIITKGVTVGSRSIIAAGSVVVKSIPDDCLAGGNPCSVIKKIN